MPAQRNILGSHTLSEQPADRRSKSPDIVLTVLGIVGLILFLAFYDQAFPSAALDLELSRQEVTARATGYMHQLGHDLSDYESAIIFREARMPSFYLQQTLGIPRTNTLAREQGLPLWFWRVRWFKPLQQEEFGLSLMPDGTVVAMSHTLPEDAPGLNLPQSEARTLAELYLTRDRGWDLGDWELVSASTETRPGGRADHHFEWKRMDWSIGDSELRLAVDIQGDSAGGYGYWLDVPEAFERRFGEQQNRAGFINNLSYYLGLGLFGGAAALFYFLGHRRGVFTWHEGVKAGVLVGGVDLLAALNWLPLSKGSYGTTQDYAVFWVNALVSILIGTVSLAGVVILLWGGGRYLARKVWPRQDRLLPRGDDHWIALSRSTWRGLMVGCLGAGYVVLFYLVATQVLGGWTPMGAPDVNLYATPLPFLAPLAAGVIPAVTEEFLFRLVGIGVAWALVRRRWLAVLVPGVLWAFAHLAYVRDPIYLRGVELTIKAVLYGYAFLQFGLVTTIVAHLAYNAGLNALPLLRSEQPYFIASGALVLLGLLAPLIPGAVRLIRQRLRGAPAVPRPTIRPATVQDLPALSDLNVAGAHWIEWLEDPTVSVLCLQAEGRIVGAATGRVEADGPGRVSVLFVAPGWRRRYWGSRLAQALCDRLRERGAPSVQVTIASGEWIPARFWDAQGWIASATTYEGRLAPSAQGILSMPALNPRQWLAAMRDRLKSRQGRSP
jgi:Type II CAAX prenyl endopeptidase Rce1-like/Acetyltransferase (GNAT) family